MFFPAAFTKILFPSPTAMTLQQSMALDKDLQARVPTDGEPLLKLKELQASLRDNTISPAYKNKILTLAIQACKNSIEKENIDKLIVFKILRDIISDLITSKSLAGNLSSRDKQDMTVLHQLIQLGDDWYPVIEELLSQQSERLNDCDNQGRSSLSLAADVGAFTTFIKLQAFTTMKSEKSLLQAKYEEKFKNRSQEDIDTFIENNPDPNKVKIACLITRYPEWKEAYNTLKDYIEDKNTTDSEKVRNIQRALAFDAKGLPRYLDAQFIKEPWAIRLFIAVSWPIIFNFFLKQEVAALTLFKRAAKNPNVSYYLVKTDDRYIKASFEQRLSLVMTSGWLLKQPALTVDLLKNSLYREQLQKSPYSIQLLNGLGKNCGFPSVFFAGTANEEKAFIQRQADRIIEWVPEKIMLDTIFSLFGYDANKLDDIVKREKQGLSKDKLKEAIHLATQDKSLTEPKDQNGNNIFHLACFYEARKTFEYLLEQVVRSNNNPQKAIDWTLSIKNQEDETPYDLCSLVFQEAMEAKVSTLLETSKISPQP